MRRKHNLPSIARFDIDIDIAKLQQSCDALANKFVDVMTANPNLCMNHEELIKNVYDVFEQINLTESNGELMEFTSDIKERIRRKEERLFIVPTAE
jgi:4-aminobutyrate aminotransferase-like enzyme